ncbi:MAG: hypothetical protein PUB69_04310, partial [Desulfovibrionaceae bacterium]|nr:hypothetical protein [Desulfovibrionaceae bacterium]
EQPLFLSPPSHRLFPLRFPERQKFVPVVFVLLPSGCDFGRKAGNEVIAQGVETVENAHYFRLNGAG